MVRCDSFAQSDHSLVKPAGCGFCNPPGANLQEKSKMSFFSSALVAAFVFGAPPLLIFFITRLVQRFPFWSWFTPAALIGWFLSANIVGYFVGVSKQGPLPPLGLLEIVVPLVVALTILFGSKSFRLVLEQITPGRLIGIQVYRLGGLLFLYLYFQDHFVSRGFALGAGIGDILVGLTAPFVARWGNRNAAVVWNIVGIIDLVMAPVSAVRFGFQGIGTYPLVLIPLFLGPPLGLFLHAASQRNLYLRGFGNANGKDPHQTYQ